MMRKMFGEFLVDEGFITPRQLSAGLHTQERLRHRRVGEILVDHKRLRADALARVVADQLAQMVKEDGERMPIGQRLVEEGLVSEADVAHALELQHGYREVRIGEVIVELGFMTRAQLEHAIRARLEELAAA